MPPPALTMSKYAFSPSANCAYLPPIGFVFVVMTATRISLLESSTPGPRPGTKSLRDAAGTVVAAAPDPAAVVVGADDPVELLQPAATTAAIAKPIRPGRKPFLRR